MIIERSGSVCELCGALPADQVHHRRPRGLGGTSDPTVNRAANGLAVCRWCHDVIEGRSVEHPQLGRVRGSRAESERKGWLISRLSPDGPDEVPVWTAVGWVQLSDGGEKRRIEG
ncbi:HNH endonuclease, partial [Tsukamurella ocularis]